MDEVVVLFKCLLVVFGEFGNVFEEVVEDKFVNLFLEAKYFVWLMFSEFFL
jgi:hypothetical protein